MHAILEAQKNVILSAVNTQIQGLQSSLLKAQTDLASQIASEVQPDTHVFKKKGNEQQSNFNRKVIKRSSAAVTALESGNIGKAKEELNEGISLLKDVRANCFCASLLRMKFTRHVMHRARVLSSKVNNNRANGDRFDFAWI